MISLKICFTSLAKSVIFPDMFLILKDHAVFMLIKLI